MYHVTLFWLTLTSVTSLVPPVRGDVVPPEVAAACHTHQQDIARALSPDQRKQALTDVMTLAMTRDSQVKAFGQSRDLSVDNDGQMNKLTSGLYLMLDMAARQSALLQSMLPFFRTLSASAPPQTADVILHAYLATLPGHMTSYDVTQAQVCVRTFLQLVFAKD